MRKLIFLLFITSYFYACSSNDNNTFNSTKIEIVTGQNLIDNFGNSVGKVGNPNVLRNSMNFAVYPNPAINVLRISIASSAKNIWIIKGQPTKNFSNIDFNATLNENLYTSSEIKANSIFNVENIGKTTINIDLTRYEKGHYRVFVELEDGTINWENIYFKASEIAEVNYWK